MPAEDSTIRPFQVGFPEAELTELRRRVNATRWPERETVTDDSQGVPLAMMQELARYWGTDYDWRKCEAKLNALPHFMTEIDGLDIHFIHVRSPHEDALPLIVTHGWPGSIIEQLKIIEPLTNPTAHGASAADAFHLVIPSLPGHGFSAKPTSHRVGSRPHRRAWVVLMKRLGYTRFVAQGGDWGAAVTQQMGDTGRAGAGSAFTPTCLVPPRPTSTRRSSAATRRHRICPPRRKRAYEQLSDLLRQARGLRADHDDAPADAVRTGGLTRRPGRVHARPRRRHRPARARRTGPAGTPAERPDPRRHPRQHHAVLADQHRDLRGPPVLGEQGGLLRRQAHHDPVRHQRLPRRALPGPAELGRARLSQATSSTTTSSTGAATSPPGNSRTCSPPRCGPRSRRCANQTRRAPAAPAGPAASATGRQCHDSVLARARWAAPSLGPAAR